MVGAWRDDVVGDTGTDGGARLAVHVTGPADGPPVVLLHGWAQSARVWTGLRDGPLGTQYRLIAADLRGHGCSARPPDGYDLSANWAGDVRALLAYAGSPALLVGWSYGGLVITDYVRRHGTTDIAGIVLVGAITEIGRGRPGGRVGPVMRAALPDAVSEDRAVAEPALRRFVAGMAPELDSHWLLDGSMRASAAARAGMFAREVDNADLLAAIDVPTLIVHGRRDQVVDPSAAEYAAGLIPDTTLVWLDTGHLPFVEDQAAFDRVVVAHADRCLGRVA